jgi:serine/threonine-protein kinase
MYVTRLRQPVIVPKVIGMEQKEAERTLRRKGLALRSGRVMYDERIPEGSVVLQDPRANNYVKRGAVIEVVLSRGKPRVPVPNVVNQTLRRAQNVLAQGQFRIGRRSLMSSGVVPKDTVMAQVPPPGETAGASSSVDLLVSTGPLDPAYVMPSLRRQSLEKAFQLFRPAAILIEKITTKVQDDLPTGTILAQSPPPGTRIEEKASVSLTVSTTSAEASLQPRLTNFNFTMPEGPPRRLRIDVLDSTGTRTVYNKMEEPGNPVTFEVKVTGKATAQIYLSQQFEREVPLE